MFEIAPANIRISPIVLVFEIQNPKSKVFQMKSKIQMSNLLDFDSWTLFVRRGGWNLKFEINIINMIIQIIQNIAGGNPMPNAISLLQI